MIRELKTMAIIKNQSYKRFLEEGLIDTLDETQIRTVLINLKHKFKLEARSLIICMYYTGARPNEILRLKTDDIVRDGKFLKITMQGSKRGLPRPIMLKISHGLVKEFDAYAKKLPLGVYIFYHFRNNYIRNYTNKSGEIKTITTISDKLRYYFKIWFSILFPDGIPPYYLRHNRFSKLAEVGTSMEQLRQMKGSRTLDSVTPYLHMTKKTAVDIGKKNN
jgi:site-specific recombinase XerD